MRSNSGPLSHRRDLGRPICSIALSSARVTAWPEIPVATPSEESSSTKTSSHSTPRRTKSSRPIRNSMFLNLVQGWNDDCQIGHFSSHFKCRRPFRPSASQIRNGQRSFCRPRHAVNQVWGVSASWQFEKTLPLPACNIQTADDGWHLAAFRSQCYLEHVLERYCREQHEFQTDKGACTKKRSIP
jgi:hypothetical protein